MTRSPTVDDVRRLPYVELLALIAESNMPPGGMDSVRRLALNCHLRPENSVLHAGCNTGFLAREMARLSGCHVTGVDVSQAMVDRAEAMSGVGNRVKFVKQDMTNMDLPDQSFDVTMSGGALAFVRISLALLQNG